MKNRVLLHIVITAVIAVSAAHGGEHLTLIADKPGIGVGESATVTLNAGDTAQLIFASGGVSQQFRMVATMGNSTFEIPAMQIIGTRPATAGEVYGTNPIKIVGPGSFKMKLGTDTNPGGGSEKQFATVEVNRAGIDGNPAAIPLEAGTTWQVILEASTDLVNWTPVAPGDYPSASPQRFFRTRLVKRP
jgi:hypothetical protein